MFGSKWSVSKPKHQEHEVVATRPAVNLGSGSCEAAGADVLLNHRRAARGEVLHVYVDGTYDRAVPLSEGCATTQIHVGQRSWRNVGAVHAIDVYQASVDGRVLDHQSVLVSASPQIAGEVRAQAVASSHAADAQPDVDTVEYRISRDGLPFGAWHRDYVEPASDGSEDGHYVVQMRFLGAQAQVLDLQTLSFEVRAGMVHTD